MPITDHQREQRKKRLGASDAAAVLGVSPWSTAFDVWAEKTGRALDGPPLDKDAVWIGNNVEGPLLDWAAEQTGATIKKNQYRVHKTAPLHANHDALDIDFGASNIGFEAKTSGMIWHNAAGDWGDPDIDPESVPAHVLTQCYHQMAVSDLRRVYVPALIKGRRQLYCIKRDDALVDEIVKRECEWWDKYVVGDVRPPDSAPSESMIRRLKWEPESVVAVGGREGGLVSTWVVRREQRLEAEKSEEEAKANLLALLDGNEAMTFDGHAITYRPTETRRLDQSKLKTDHPDVWRDCQKTTTSRTLRYHPKGL